MRGTPGIRPAFVDPRRRDPGCRKGPTTLFPGSPMGCNGRMTFTAPVRVSGRGSEPKSAPGFPTIVFEGVTKRYRGGGGITDVTLEVPSGEVFGFLGPNGAGKTTTIRLLLDLIRPDAGRISLFGLDARQTASPSGAGSATFRVTLRSTRASPRVNCSLTSATSGAGPLGRPSRSSQNDSSSSSTARSDRSPRATGRRSGSCRH